MTENWKRFKQSIQIYFTATGIITKGDDVKIAAFLHVAGEDAINVFNGFKWDEAGDQEGDKEKYDKVVAKFGKYCEPEAKNLIYFHYLFFTRAQEPHESFDKFLTEITKLSKDCQFDTLTDTLITSKIVCGIRGDRLKRKLLGTSDLNLARAIDMCRAYETTSKQMEALNQDKTESKTVNVLKSGGATQVCGKCGRHHALNKCPAYGQQCHSCYGYNHFAVVCKKSQEGTTNSSSTVRGSSHRGRSHRGRMRGRGHGRGQRVHILRESSDEEYYEDEETDEQPLFVAVVTDSTTKDKNSQQSKWHVNLKCNNKCFKCKIDTGAECNVMSRRDFEYLKLDEKDMVKTKSRLTSYSGHKINSVAKITIACEYKNIMHPITFHVVDGDSPTLLGVDTSENELKLVTRVNSVSTEGHDEYVRCNANVPVESRHGSLIESEMLKQYQDVFTGLGCMKGKVAIRLKDDVKPVIHPPRTVPIALKEKLRVELNRMEELGVIAKQVEPTEWVNSLVTVVKPNQDLRVCIDPKDLNEAICREHYPMNTIEKVSSNLSGAKLFTVFDARSGYWQLELDEESSHYCTMNTPFGRYRFLRAPFGLNNIPEIFQAKMSSLFENVEGVEVVMDDILIWGKTEAEHDQRVHKVLNILREANVKLNKEKLKFKKTEIAYLGHKVTADGLGIDPGKVRAVLEMQKPSDIPSLQRFLGMLTYVQRFIPDLAEKNAPLRELLLKDVAWEWSARHEACYQELIQLLCNAPVLAFYNPCKPLILSVDASSKGLGAALIQEGKPVAYASRALTKCEQNYAQIEKELLAIAYGCKRFHNYVSFREVVVETDHKPLEAIFCKPLHKTPLRLQRMLMGLQRYKLNVMYKKGSELIIADALSRAYLPETEANLGPCETPLEVYLIKEQAPLSPAKFEEFKAATSQDEVLSEVVELTVKGWPNSKENCPLKCREYWSVHDELCVADGVLFRGSRVVIPSRLRKDMLNRIHETHAGIIKCKRRARVSVYWPGMSKQIEDIISQCTECLENSRQQEREPMLSQDIPNGPWVKVASDVFEFQGVQYLVVVDYYSKFPEVYCLNQDLRARAVINAHMSIFARHGIPRELVSDNARYYDCAEFRRFAEEWEFKHTTSSPRYPRSNGQAERTVQTVKNMIKKSKNPCMALLVYRTTPLEGIGYSPSELLMGRRLNTRLPTHVELLYPKTPDHTLAQSGLSDSQCKQKRYYDRGTKELDVLPVGEGVRILKDGKWLKGIVQSKCENPRSYQVRTEEGSVLRRNRQVIRNAPDVRDIEVNIPNMDFDNVECPVENRFPQPALTNIPRGTGNDSASKGSTVIEKNNVGTSTSVTSELPTTRCGRVIKKPARYSD